MKLSFYFNTLKHCKFIQIYSRLLRKLPRTVKQFSSEEIKIKKDFRLLLSIVKSRTWLADKKFRFLNKEVDFGDSIIWSDKSLPKLWRYNLHYFDYLNQESIPGNPNDLIKDWIENNPIGSEDAWEPYPTSLRIVNWIKYFERTGKKIDDFFLANLASQINFLYKNLEFHILANHLFVNAVGLVYGGHFFDMPEAQKWLNRGNRILIEQIDEQILPDGGHYERSPMYHCIILENILDCWNLYQSNGMNIPPKIITSVEQMVHWLDKVKTPDGKIPLFNDSAYNISSEVSELINYSERLSGKNISKDTKSHAILPYSGYYIYNENGFYVIIDAGEGGPSYQPGHVHCDMLSFELWREGRPIIVDTGVYEYNSSEIRTYLRSTNAHNTVRINGVDQFEIWDSFRVARRAELIETSFEKTDTGFLFSGSCRNYLGDVHKRKMRLSGNVLFIEDSIESKNVSIVEAFLHFSPAISLLKEDDKVLGKIDSEKVFIIESNWQKVEIDTGEFYPEFGKKQANDYLHFSESDKTGKLQMVVKWL